SCSSFVCDLCAAHRDLASFLHDALPILLRIVYHRMLDLKAQDRVGDALRVALGVELRRVDADHHELVGKLRLELLQLGQDVHARSEEHTSELQSQSNLVCRLLLEKKKIT